MKNILLLLLFFSILTKVKAQNISNEGTDFWLCFPSHVASNANGNTLATLSVFITSKSNTSGVVSCGTFSQSFTVTANQVTEVLVPRANSYINDGTGISTNKGIRVLIDVGKPKAVVYGHVFAGARSAATLVLPVLALGQKYYTAAYEQSSIGKSQFNVVCVEANTVLKITPRINGNVQATFQVTLANVGDVYEYQNDDDITGTYIEVDPLTSSCKRFAAFSGSSALAILSPGCVPPGSNTSSGLNTSYDPLFQQLYPLESWGTSFPLVPFYDRNTGAIFRVIASVNNTIISIGGNSVTLNAGQFYQTTPVTAVSVITSNQPIMVAQYAITQYCADSRNYGVSARPSDPDMVILNPLEYSIKDVTMYSSTKLAISDQFLNVMIPNTGLASFKINGVSQTNKFSAVPGNSTYSYAQINLRQIGGSNFNLTSDYGFNAMAYGFGDYESYAYSAGTNLASSVFINAVRPSTNQIINNACKDEEFDFRLVLPYISTKLVWTLDVGETPIIQNNPTYTSFLSNGKTLYDYRLPVNKIYTTSGSKKITIVSSIPLSSGGCPSGDEILNFDFDVYDPPIQNSFSVSDDACVNNPVQFTAIDNIGGRPIITYYWDFGDGTLSNEKNPIHVFTSIGTKTVSLYVENDVVCVSNAFSQDIQILSQPIPDFISTAVSCAQQTITFTDNSNLMGNTIISYLWDFGDGTTSILQNPVHTYASAGNFSVSLKLVTSADCEITVLKSKQINVLPTIDFDLPASCVSDLVNFVTTNKSSNITSYEWDFGDGSNDLVQRTKEFPSHQYTSSGFYNVKVKVTSVDGCTSEIIKTITINAANPIAGFTTLNSGNLCSNMPVQFQDNSSISFGNITKLEWIYDYSIGGVNTKVVINNPASLAVYEHSYPNTSSTMNYQVMLRAYSGDICFQDYGPINITINGSPNVVFSPITNTCLNSNKFKLTAATEQNGMAGTGIYSGTGVDVNGNFDPAVSGVGTFQITYTFVANNGCSDIKNQDITVFAVPSVSLGQDVVILKGGQTVINAQAAGTGLSYKWIPSIGLSQDNVLNPTASPNQTTNYTLLVTSSDGCVIADEIKIIVADYPNIPNTFTPNSDGVNDTWNIQYLDTYINCKVTIFNRFGSQVFNSNGYSLPWDGKTNGKDLPVGVYYYIIDPRIGIEKYSGSVTIIR
jgi:gliding motility-associated-like protein